MQRLELVRLPEKARKYSDLRRAVIRSRLSTMISMAQNTFLPQLPFAGGVNSSGQEYNMMPPATYAMGECFGPDGMQYFDGFNEFNPTNTGWNV